MTLETDKRLPWLVTKPLFPPLLLKMGAYAYVQLFPPSDFHLWCHNRTTNPKNTCQLLWKWCRANLNLTPGWANKWRTLFQFVGFDAFCHFTKISQTSSKKAGVEGIKHHNKTSLPFNLSFRTTKILGHKDPAMPQIHSPLSPQVPPWIFQLVIHPREQNHDSVKMAEYTEYQCVVPGSVKQSL